jgi:two-component system, sporulation sensor kinase E
VIESERVQALTLLAASVAHEIGNPLNALNIHLQLMEREAKRLQSDLEASPVMEAPRSARRKSSTMARDLQAVEKLQSYVKVAKGEIARLDYIVTQFLQAIRPTPLRMQMTALNDVVRTTLELMRPELENRGLMVTEKLGSNLPLVMMDGAQVKQVLVNLIKNSMQAMTKGGVLSLSTGQTSDDLWITISDTGGGIPQEKLKRIFEPFFTTKQKGTGLGLIIVQRIMRAHGGRIDLDSRVGEGTSFRLWFPLHEPQRRLLEAPLHD